MSLRSRRTRLVVLLGVLTAALAPVGTALATTGDSQKAIPGGWIKLRERSPLAPVLIVRRRGQTAYVKLTPAKSPGVCGVVHWHVQWPFVTVVAQPGEDHGGRLDCDTDLDRSVIWVVDFSTSLARPPIYAAGLDSPIG